MKYNMLSAKGEIVSHIELVPSSFDVVLYHRNCPDGIGGAFPFWKENIKRMYHGDFQLHGVMFNEPYPNIKNKMVMIVDFSYKREVIKEICSQAKIVYILDHHKTALNELKGLEKELPNFGYIFDMDRSGAQIAWDWCYPRAGFRPWFVEIIADRDLWLWKLPHSKEIGKALFHMGYYTWERMDELLIEFNNLWAALGSKDDAEKIQKDRFINQGYAITRYETKEIENAVKTSTLCTFEGYRVRLATCAPTLRSEVGNMLANMNDCDFSATWRYIFDADQWWISLRGADNSDLALNDIAEKFGGGGHPKACGFTIYGNNSSTFTTKNEHPRGDLKTYFQVIKLE